MAKSGDIVVGLDIGTTKICAIVGELTDEGGIDIIGIGTHPSKGLRKGVVVNIDATVASIKRAIEEAEPMAGCEITTVYTGIAGGHIKGFNTHGIVAVKDKEVRDAGRRPGHRRGQGGGHPPGPRGDPRPAAGVHHRRPGRHQGAAGHERRAPRGQGAHRHRRGLVGPEHRQVRQPDRPQRGRHRAPAAGLVRRRCSRRTRRSWGCAWSTSAAAPPTSPSSPTAPSRTPRSSALGGNHLTNDIAIGLRTPAHEAERIKQKYGCALASMVDKDETIEVPSVGGRQPRASSPARSWPRSSSRGWRRSSSWSSARSRSAAIEDLLAAGW